MSFLNLSSEPSPERSKQPETAKPGDRRKFIGVKFNCCGIYVRIYANKDGTAYEGRCPKCFKSVKFKIGSGGTDNRFFEAY